MIRYVLYLFFVLNLSSIQCVAESKSLVDLNRGTLLYEVNCQQCHNQQVHWRDAKIVVDIKSLTDQVERWQRNTGLDWDKSDITEVSRYLNSKYYHFP